MVTQHARPSTQPALDLQIEELVLHGFAPGDRQRIGAAIAGELRRLLAEQGLPPALARGGQVDRMDGGAFSAAPGATAEATGAQIARAVYTRMGR
jgi:hypothetical protein